MKTEIYGLEKEDLEEFKADITKEIMSNVGKEGFYTIGAIDVSDGKESAVGFVQFYVDIRDTGECFGKITDVYVPAEYRRNGVGTKLVDKVTEILKKSDIKSCIAFLPDEPGKEFIIPVKDFSSFLTETDFFPTKEAISGDAKSKESANGRLFVRMTRG